MSSRLIETHRARNPRLLLFHAVIAGMVVLLVGRLSYLQFRQTTVYTDKARLQNQRRVIAPGPRGNITDRNGNILVENRARLSAVLNLVELRPEFQAEYKKIKNRAAALAPDALPSVSAMELQARTSVAQRYFDQVNRILGRDAQVLTGDLNRHIKQQLLLPFVLLDDLAPEEYARLIERLPVKSPLQVYTTPARHYPYNSAAAHVLGYVGVTKDPVVEDFEGEDLRTFKMPGTLGRDGLEKVFEDRLHGETGAWIYLVDPGGYMVKSSNLPFRPPVQGHDIQTSLDIDLQLAAEEAIGDRRGAAVALDVRTGEVLALTSKPDYDLNSFVPRLSPETFKAIEDAEAWSNQAISGAYPPGSTFKIITTIAGLRSGALIPSQSIANCTGHVTIGGRTFVCDSGDGRHGEANLPTALAESCDIYYYEAGRQIGADLIAAEARRFHLDRPTGIELTNETSRMLIPDPEWKRKQPAPKGEPWYPGDTANMSIGQGFTVVTPLQMACMVASVARNETYTKPTILHNPSAPTQHTEPIGLTPAQRAALLEGMEGCTTFGTADIITKLPSLRIPGVRIAGKTGTAQKRVTQGDKTGTINYAWFVCFAPIENPEIAVAVMLEGDTIGETYGGGRNSGPVASAILKKYFEKKAQRVEPKEFKLN